MKKNLSNKTIVIGIIVLFVGTSVIPITATNVIVNKICFITFDGKTLYVGGSGPGNYSTIQDAIDDAFDGDTVFVYDDSSPYDESLLIEKIINLLGENKETTTISGSSIGDVIIINANWINISGFTIQNSGSNGSDAGIEIHSKFNHIVGNIILNNDGGISLVNTSGNTLTGNIISNNDYGIRFFTNCRSNTILGNTINSNKFRGIRLEASDSNFILGNNISNNGNGIRLEDSIVNIISDNNISNNGNGIDLYSSSGTTILGNTFFNDGFQIYDSYQNTVSNNMVNGKPLIYLESESNMVIDEAGQVILINCDNITIENQDLSNITFGIELWQTNNCLISSNILNSNDYDGIYLHSSSNNTITGNTISNNSNGISLDYLGSNNVIIDNIISNNAFGIHLYYSSSNTIISRNNFLNNLDGIRLFFSHNIIITNNNFSNSYFGISLWYSNNTTIFSNNLLNCVDGIWLNNAKDNIISQNTIIKSEFDGIWLFNSIYNTITGNTIINCMLGIDFYISNNNIVQNNTFIRGGMIVTNSFHNTVTNNIVNDKSLVYLEDTSDIVINEAGQVILINCDNITVQNLDLSNIIIGVELWGTDSCHISSNTLADNYYGSGFINSNNNTFSSNNISNHRNWGIFLISSNDNTISDNNIHIDNVHGNRFILFNRNISIPQTTYFNDDLQNPQSHQNPTSSINDLHLWRINDKNLVLANNDFDESRGIQLRNCYRNIIKGNNIKNNQDGIIFEISNSNTIMGNKILSNNRSGIRIINSENNSIIRNTIACSNENGIYLKNSDFNRIKKNNFIENNQNALFENSLFNRWCRNYWSRTRVLPKLIFGKMEIGSKWILWINIDWRPALRPYVI